MCRYVAYTSLQHALLPHGLSVHFADVTNTHAHASGREWCPLRWGETGRHLVDTVVCLLRALSSTVALRVYPTTMQSTGSLLARLAFAAQRTHQSGRLFSAAVELRKAGPVPDGHLNSDLSPTVCHIGLGRRRDLTLRQDLCLWDGDKKFSLSDVFRVSLGRARLRG